MVIKKKYKTQSSKKKRAKEKGEKNRRLKKKKIRGSAKKKLPKRKKIVKKKKKIRKVRQLAKKKKERQKEGKTLRKRRSKIFTEEKVEKLIEKGQERGFITVSEIMYFFPNVEKDIKGLEMFYEELERRGIEVEDVEEFLAPVKKTRTLSGRRKIDPVQMYLKEIGRVSFLTADQEKELSRKIEKGDEEAKRN